MDTYLLHNDPRIEAAFLRVSWYESDDGSGSAILSLDSELLESPAPGYRHVTTGPLQAPPGVHSAAARIMLRPFSDAGAVLYIDDVSFREAGAPPGGASASADDPDGDVSSAGSSGNSGGRSSGSGSAVAGVSRPPEPQPTPVLRRDLLVTEIDGASDEDRAARWPWAVAGVAASVVVASWGWTWWRRRA
jgi:hypothetical protein